MRNYWSTETDAVKVSPSLLKAGWQERGRNVLERVEGVGDIETRRCIKDCRDRKKQKRRRAINLSSNSACYSTCFSFVAFVLHSVLISGFYPRLFCILRSTCVVDIVRSFPICDIEFLAGRFDGHFKP